MHLAHELFAVLVDEQAISAGQHGLVVGALVHVLVHLCPHARRLVDDAAQRLDLDLDGLVVRVHLQRGREVFGGEVRRAGGLKGLCAAQVSVDAHLPCPARRADDLLRLA